ncbi:MAG: glycosyltransferase family 2 protein [Candidatus Daviesbacteria bacterium]|nr:glycosyltransferase family 2 protein [Candidatus Daviesbacteria bacterium]
MEIASRYSDLIRTFHLHRELHFLGSIDYINKHGDSIRSRLKSFTTTENPLDIVVPAFNEQNFLPACLDALSRQTTPVRVLVVNNCSTDETSATAERLGVSKIIDQPHPGIGATKKAGILATTSPFLLITDADSAPLPTWSASMLNAISRNSRLLAAYSPVLFHDADTLALYLYNLLSITGKLAKDLLKTPHYQGASTVLKSEVRDWINKENDPQAGDDGLTFRIINKHHGKVAWNWNINSLVFTSARRIKTQGLNKVLMRRVLHLLTGNSDIAYYSLYSDWERGSLKSAKNTTAQ